MTSMYQNIFLAKPTNGFESQLREECVKESCRHFHSLFSALYFDFSLAFSATGSQLSLLFLTSIDRDQS